MTPAERRFVRRHYLARNVMMLAGMIVVATLAFKFTSVWASCDKSEYLVNSWSGPVCVRGHQ